MREVSLVIENRLDTTSFDSREPPSPPLTPTEGDAPPGSVVISNMQVETAELDSFIVEVEELKKEETSTSQQAQAQTVPIYAQVNKKKKQNGNDTTEGTNETGQETSQEIGQTREDDGQGTQWQWPSEAGQSTNQSSGQTSQTGQRPSQFSTHAGFTMNKEGLFVSEML